MESAHLKSDIYFQFMVSETPDIESITFLIHVENVAKSVMSYRCNRSTMQVICTSLQTDNHTSTSPLSFFYKPDALPGAQPTVSY